jgi:outer membrane protein TolC
LEKVRSFGLKSNFSSFEALQKTRKAKAEATLYKLQLDDAKDLINMQVTQLREQRDEAYERLRMASSNLENAEENMRVASIGFEEGVITANTALAAQTAWLQAHSEYIDAGIDLQMASSSLQKAEGNMTENK